MDAWVFRVLLELLINQCLFSFLFYPLPHDGFWCLACVVGPAVSSLGKYLLC